MLIKRVVWIVVMTGLMLSAMGTLLAQDLSQTYTSDDGRLTLNYPAGWITGPNVGFGTGFYTSEGAVSSGYGVQYPGDASFFIVLSDTQIGQMFSTGGTGPADTVKTVANLMTGGDSTVTISEPLSSQLGDKTITSVEATGSTTSMFIAAVDLGNGMSLVGFGSTAPGELSTFEPQYLAMLNSVQFSAVAATAVPVELNLQTITPEDAAQLSQIWTVNLDRSCYNAASFSPDGKEFAACDLRKNLTLVDSATGKTLESLSPGMVTEATVAYRTLFSPDGQTLAAAEGSRTLVLHDIPTATDTTIQLDADTLIVDMAFKPGEGTPLAYITRDSGMVGLLSPDGTNNLTIPLEEGYEGANVAYSPTGDTILYSYWLGYEDTTNVVLWDVAQNQAISKTEIQGSPLGLYFLPDGKPIAVTTHFKTNHVLVWDVAANSQIAEFAGHEDTVVHVALNTEGTLLATGSYDTTVRVWNVQTGEQLISLPHEYTDLRVSFSPDSHMLLTADQLGNTFLWGVQ